MILREMCGLDKGFHDDRGMIPIPTITGAGTGADILHVFSKALEDSKGGNIDLGRSKALGRAEG